MKILKNKMLLFLSLLAASFLQGIIGSGSFRVGGRKTVAAPAITEAESKALASGLQGEIKSLVDNLSSGGDIITDAILNALSHAENELKNLDFANPTTAAREARGYAKDALETLFEHVGVKAQELNQIAEPGQDTVSIVRKMVQDKIVEPMAKRYGVWEKMSGKKPYSFEDLKSALSEQIKTVYGLDDVRTLSNNLEFEYDTQSKKFRLKLDLAKKDKNGDAFLSDTDVQAIKGKMKLGEAESSKVVFAQDIKPSAVIPLDMDPEDFGIYHLRVGDYIAMPEHGGGYAYYQITDPGQQEYYLKRVTYAYAEAESHRDIKTAPREFVNEVNRLTRGIKRRIGSGVDPVYTVKESLVVELQDRVFNNSVKNINDLVDQVLDKLSNTDAGGINMKYRGETYSISDDGEITDGANEDWGDTHSLSDLGFTPEFG